MALLDVEQSSNGQPGAIIANAGGSGAGLQIKIAGSGLGSLAGAPFDVITGSTNHVFDIVQNGSVGIGTTSPGFTLDVHGQGHFNNGVRLGNGYSVIDVDNSASGLFFGGSAGALNMAIVPGGNVGIGTTSPGSKLQINGNAAIGYSTSTAAPTNGLAVSGNVGIGTTAPGYALDVVGGGRIGNSDGWNDWIFDTSGQATIRPSTGAGILGLDSGGGAALNFYTFLTFPGNHEAVGPDLAAMGSYNLGITSNGGTLILDNNTTGGSSFTLRPGVAQHDFAATNLIILGGADQGVQGAAEPGGSVYISGTVGYSGGTSGNVILGYNGSGYVGNVGIGTTSPSGALSVASGTGIISYASTSGRPYWNYTYTTSNVQWAAGFDQGGSTNDFSIANIYSGTRDVFHIENTAPANSMRIQASTGNVGIGTTSPQNLLDVNGATSIGYNVAAPTNGLIVSGNVGIGTTTSTGGAALTVNGTAVATSFSSSLSGVGNYLTEGSTVPIDRPSTNVLRFGTGFFSTLTFNNSGVEAMRISSGSVGIGTTSPNAALDVNGAILTECVTVATLPTGKQGMRHCVTDASSCTFLGAITGGSSTFCPVVYNGSAWVAE